MTDDRDRDDQRFHRAATSLRAAGARDEDALRETIEALHREALNEDTGELSIGRTVRTQQSHDRRSRTRRKTLVGRGTLRFVAGLAAGIAFASGLGLGIFAGWQMRGESVRLASENAVGRAGPTLVEATVAASRLRPVQFMLVAPAASRVALVGEFNDWDAAATPMARAPGGAWHVAMPLATGRHVYAFVVDGTSWVADPQAPLAPEGFYGMRNSVLLVNAEQRQ